MENQLTIEMPRKDWDYVSMEDYSKDTKDLVDQAAHIIAMQKHEIERMKRVIHALVASAKRIEVSNYLLMDDPLPGIRVSHRLDIDAVVYEVEHASEYRDNDK